jgi:hypothetical protein
VSPALAGEELHLRYLQKLLPPAAEAAKSLGSSRAAVQYLASMADKLRAGKPPPALNPVPRSLYARVVPGEEAGPSAAEAGEVAQRAAALAALAALYHATSAAPCVRATDAGTTLVLPELQAQLLDAEGRRRDD